MIDHLILNIAGFNIQINFKKTEWEFAYEKLKKEILHYFQGFIVQKKNKIDYFIDIEETTTLILNKKYPEKYFVNFFDKKKDKTITTYYQISLLQFQMILREALIDLLAKNRGFVSHGSAVEKDKVAFIFTGKNRAGKSTAMRLLYPKLTALADDTVIIKKENGRYFLYQTPFIEKNDWIYKTNKKYLIESVFFLKKSHNFRTEKIKNKEKILKMMINQFWSSEKNYKKQIKYLFDFVENFNQFYYLYFAKNRDRLINLLKKYEVEN